MTNEEIAEAAATKVAKSFGHCIEDNPAWWLARHAALLILNGWKPPVDPLVLEAREICAREATAHGLLQLPDDYLAGEGDDHFAMRCAIAALRSKERAD